MSKMNRMATLQNPYQGDAKKVLCVCSTGLLRSPTAAVVLSQPPFDFNTRAAGISREFALIPVDKFLVAWADEIVVMESWMADHILGDLSLGLQDGKHVVVLDIPDDYSYRDSKLMELIRTRYQESLDEQGNALDADVG